MEKSHGMMMNAMGYFLRFMGAFYRASYMTVSREKGTISFLVSSLSCQVLMLFHWLDDKFINLLHA